MSANTNTDRRFPVLPTQFRVRRGLAFGIIIVTALLAFEIFNYSSTEYALSDLLNDMSFMGFRWATILAIAFCGIDFAGIARLFTPEEGEDEPTEVWYLFGAWLLAATMNAMLTWWGVSKALANNPQVTNTFIAHDTILRVVPIFVAVLVWLIRVLIIGTFSVAGDRLFSQRDRKSSGYNRSSNLPRGLPGSARRSQTILPANTPRPAASTTTFRPSPKTTASDAVYPRAEPTYHPTSAVASPPGQGGINSKNVSTRTFSSGNSIAKKS